MPVEVKVCGLTRPADATAAGEAGADWLGVVFASGPRVVSAAQAATIVAAAGKVPVLGVFAAHPLADMLHLIRMVGLAGAQLHGPYTPSDAGALKREGLVVWRVVRAAAESDLAALDDEWEVDGTLVEARVPHADGGSGVRLAAPLAVAARARLRGRCMILAGGLSPESVGSAVGLVAPDVVDVSSGVESRPGIKDPDKIGRFVEAVRGRRAVV